METLTQENIIFNMNYLVWQIYYSNKQIAYLDFCAELADKKIKHLNDFKNEYVGYLNFYKNHRKDEYFLMSEATKIIIGLNHMIEQHENDKLDKLNFKSDVLKYISHCRDNLEVLKDLKF